MKGNEVKEIREKTKLSVREFAFVLRIKPSKLKELESTNSRIGRKIKSKIFEIWGHLCL